MNYSSTEILTSKTTILNPLDIFPSKKDTISRGLYSIDKPRNQKKLHKLEKWLELDNPNEFQYGICGDRQPEYTRRSYQRIENNQLLKPLGPREVHLLLIVVAIF